MPVTEGSETTSTNNTTAVTVVSAPASSRRRSIKNINIYNADTVNAEVTLYVDDNSTLINLLVITLEPGDTLIYDDIVILDATTKSVKAVLTGAVTTNQLPIIANYIEIT